MASPKGFAEEQETADSSRLHVHRFLKVELPPGSTSSPYHMPQRLLARRLCMVYSYMCALVGCAHTYVYIYVYMYICATPPRHPHFV